MEPKNKIILRKSSPYLPEETVNQIARKTGFSKRVRKITPFAFFQSCCLLSVYAVNSLSSWAVLMGFLVRKTISKQAIAKRLDSESVLFIRHLFFAALKTTSRLNFRIDNGDFSGFRRVLIHDSTSVRLPDRLISLFPGTGNQKKENAALKIQTVYDALSEYFIGFGLTPYRRNDRTASPDILSVLKFCPFARQNIPYNQNSSKWGGEK